MMRIGFRRVGRSVRSAAVVTAVLAGVVAACSSSSAPSESTLADAGAADAEQIVPDASQAFPRAFVEGAFAAGHWSDALNACVVAEQVSPDDCDARYCEFLARTMLVSDQFSSYLIPRYRQGGAITAFDNLEGQLSDALFAAAGNAGEEVVKRSCSFDLPLLPVTFGDPADPLLHGEVRGRFTTRTAHLLTGLLDGVRFVYESLAVPATVPPLQADGTAPPLPALLVAMQGHLKAQDALLISDPADPSIGKGGWLDRNGNRVPDAADELLVDIFVPGTNQRVFDFSDGEFVKGESLPLSALTPTESLPPSACGYAKFHIDTVADGDNVGSADGVSIGPDGKLAFPLMVNGKFEVNVSNADGTNVQCLTCGQPGPNDGARIRPSTGDAIVFVSNRDHPYALGGDGAGFGQELYAMRPDGSGATRLTTSHGYATNYHANFSPDGKRIVWGRTESYGWDVMVADFVSDAQGVRLENTRRVVHDSTWWETHGFTNDGKEVITTNTRNGFQSTDLYAVDIATGAKRRLTTDPAWDEHAHLSPDGRKIAWISGRWHPASVNALTDGSLSPVNDFLWIAPGIFFDVDFPPVSFQMELTLMDADGGHVQQLTTDDETVADNQWSADGRRIIFRQSNPVSGKNRIRVLTFDDCVAAPTKAP